MANYTQQRMVVKQWTIKKVRGNITASQVAVLTGNASGGKQRIVDSILINNTTAGGLTWTARYLPSGESIASADHDFATAETLAANARVAVQAAGSQGGMSGVLTLDPGDTLYLLGSATGMNYIINYREEI